MLVSRPVTALVTLVLSAAPNTGEAVRSMTVLLSASDRVISSC